MRACAWDPRRLVFTCENLNYIKKLAVKCYGFFFSNVLVNLSRMLCFKVSTVNNQVYWEWIRVFCISFFALSVCFLFNHSSLTEIGSRQARPCNRHHRFRSKAHKVFSQGDLGCPGFHLYIINFVPWKGVCSGLVRTFLQSLIRLNIESLWFRLTTIFFKKVKSVLW